MNFPGDDSLVRVRYEELIDRDKANLDIFWLRDESLEEFNNLADPDVLTQDIVVPRLASLGTTLSQGPRLQAVASVEGSKISKPPSNNSAQSPQP